MALGPTVRRLMSPELERKAAGVYRAVFVDLKKIARLLADQLPQDARLLDIGGGDGELLNYLLDRRPDVTVVMVDVAAGVGRFITPGNRGRVVFHPGTSIEDHARGLDLPYTAALVSDVMHHLPVDYRGPFLGSVHAALAPGAPMFIKDIEPGHPIASLSLFCDKYVSGDRGVVLVSMAALRALGASVLPKHHADEVGLYAIDRPNYLVRFDFTGHGVAA